jgi:hypothetical protein
MDSLDGLTGSNDDKGISRELGEINSWLFVRLARIIGEMPPSLLTIRPRNDTSASPLRIVKDLVGRSGSRTVLYLRILTSVVPTFVTAAVMTISSIDLTVASARETMSVYGDIKTTA